MFCRGTEGIRTAPSAARHRRGGAFARTALLGMVLVALASGARAQVNSPYSNYGFGDLQPQAYAWARGMGHLEAGLIDPSILNLGNPASYGWINRAALDLGIDGGVHTLRDDATGATNRSGNGSISHLALGLPVWKNRMGLTLGLTPYSRVSYALRQEVVRDSTIGLERLDYEGNGTLYKAHVGLGGRWKNLSAGVNASFLFGTLNYARFVTFLDTLTEGAYSTQATRSESVRDVVFDGGLAYRVDFPGDLELNLGVTGRLNTPVSATERVRYTTLLIGAAGVAVKDSVPTGQPGTASSSLPAQLALGFTLRQNFRRVDDPLWRVGAEFRRSWWSGFTDLRGNDVFTDAWEVRAGGEFTPGDRPDNNRRPLDYRFGFRYGEGYLAFDGQPLTEFGMTFGLGIPVSYGYGPQRASKIQVALEYGQRGSDAFYTESFLRGSLGFTLSDSFWFLRSKIN
jgi:hypothetical protein